MKKLRFDNFLLDSKNVEMTPSGGIKVNAYLSRTGFQSYFTDAGDELIEYRPPEEVFSIDSLETFKGAPVTEGHPTVPVNPDNWSKLAKGHVSDSVEPVEDKFVTSKLLIQDAGIVKDVLSGTLSEISCGYTCDLEETPGEIDGQKYDAVQKNIRINHVALLPVGQARGGRELTVRFDSKGNIIMPEETMKEVPETDQEEEKQLDQEGLEEEKSQDQEEDVIQSILARLEALEALMTGDQEGEEEKQMDEEEEKKEDEEEEKKEDEEEEEKEDEEEKKMTVDQLVERRVALLTTAKKLVTSEIKLDGLKNNEIRLAVLKANKLSVPPKRTNDTAYLTGAFEALSVLKETKKESVKFDEVEKKLSIVQSAKKSGTLKELQDKWADRLNRRS